MKNTFKYIAALLMILSCMRGVAQIPGYEAGKEKIYIQTDHVFYKPGGQIFFKIYLVRAQDQTPSFLSPVVYVDIINPAGSVVQKLNYKITQGYSDGSWDIAPDAVGGIYKMKAYTTWMQNETDSTFFTKEITVQKYISPRLLMKLDIPGKGYGAGDEVTADYSVRNLADQPIRNTEGKFTVTIAGAAYKAGTFKTDKNGKAAVKFTLPAELNSNDGLLNITMEYDAYTESISRSIPIVLNKIDLQFMPEGGALLEGAETNVAFKALNEFGKAADISGEVLDDAGNRIASFKSYHMGMGAFPFTPQAGRNYYARITSPAGIQQQYKLPAAQSGGIIMNIIRQGGGLFAKITSSYATPAYLAGSVKGRYYFTKELSLAKGETMISIDTAAFPAGIVQFTLYNAVKMPVAERLAFLSMDKVLQVSITTDKQKYAPRELVTMTLKTLDEAGHPVPANLSLSVVDDKLWTFADDKQDHILSWLLLSSELKGKVEEPQFYFKKDEPKAAAALDLLMLTNGYRYFDYIEYVRNQGKLKFSADEGNILSGIILNEKQEPVKGKVILVNNFPGGKVTTMNTGKDGAFFFTDMVPNYPYEIIAKSANRKEKVSIKVLQNGLGYNPLSAAAMAKDEDDGLWDLMKKNAPAAQPVEKKMQQKFFIDNDFEKGHAELQNVVVTTALGIRRQAKELGYASTVLTAKELVNGNVSIASALNGKVSGLSIVTYATPGAASKISIRGIASLSGNNEPMIIVDGAPVSRLSFAANVNDIETVTILKGMAATAIYGAEAANGLILIETKKSRSEKITIDLSAHHYYALQSIYSAGNISYSAARKFYVPSYASTETKERTDFRETIYWNPVVQTDKNGLATVKFYNSDATTTFRATAEGIGYNGRPGRTEKTYAAQNMLSVDAKIPPYLTVGDRALIPLVIKNNSANNMQLTLNVRIPEKTRTGDYPHAVSLDADSSVQVLIPLEATAATTGTISFIVSNGGHSETVTLPVAATDKGFPVIETFSGNTSAQHRFNISKMVPGSLHSNLKLLKNVEGQLLDGIESMLREPYGCFEQTSSSTYPNVYILKYLKESGKSNPAIEAKARQYIEAGYKRLAGFETAENGFEWFGKTPAHEALTAYGLLEFTDMQEFVNVDKKMLERTKQFLLNRRDNKGSFKLASGGYDRFASVPDKIANIYIVYALTQAGVGSEIRPEYDVAVKKALESNDGYQLAMMALAASNVKNERDYNALMDRLNTAYSKAKLNSETSVVNSRDASLKVETLSLYALALMRDNNPRVSVIADIVSKILGEKSYYGYGSTQATVLALHAIVEYSKLIGKAAANTDVSFMLNNKKLSPEDDANSIIAEADNSFAVKYGSDKQSIPYSFEVSYNTFVPANSAKSVLTLSTSLTNNLPKIGETTRMMIDVKNIKNELQPMAIAKIGIPAGLSLQPWQLKELMEKNRVAYYEMFDNYLVLYWMGFAANETKTINLDLKAEIPGTYTAKASNVYLYYTPEYKNWNEGAAVEVAP